ALGVVPVGVSEANWGVSDGSGLLPWAKERIEELGGETVVFKDTDGFDYEAINELLPDVILAAASGITAEEYETLSRIAPTIPYPGLAWQTSWRDQVLVNSKAMGMEEEGKQLVSDTDALIAEKVAQYPELQGKTAAFAWIDAANLSVIYIYTPTDTRPAFLQDLGLATPENVRKLAESSDEFYITISSENADLFSDVDILVTYELSEDSLAAMQADPLLGQVPAIKNGSIVAIPENALSAAISPSILSIPWALDEYLALLAEAANKVS
ncbi:MAG: ABC transporter substrate-binding protein, partial [Oscillospiraceae bacterium]|nr:ABC transporter substrate-binding protein [Oscillospiraceae bacterium]